MQEARLPENEASRLATLHSLNILDTPREARFDQYTRITARIFDTPVALISLVDRDRQWFKSAEGLNSQETPRNVSFCSHAILEDGVFEIRNARRDARFRDNALVVEHPHIRFYAGAPLAAPNGHKLGTLCIIDRVPRRLSDQKKTMLNILADMVVGEMMSHVDAEADRPDRAAQTITAAEFFDNIPDERGSSVLLFDIDDVLTSQDDADAGLWPAEIFTKLLHNHFPAARSIVHIGDFHFCVLLKADKDFDEVWAINRVCSDAKDLLCFADGHESLTPFVGRIQYGSNKYASVNDMLRDAERMFLRHETQPLANEMYKNRFVHALLGWRKTIF